MADSVREIVPAALIKSEASVDKPGWRHPLYIAAHLMADAWLASQADRALVNVTFDREMARVAKYEEKRGFELTDHELDESLDKLDRAFAIQRAFEEKLEACFDEAREVLDALLEA